MYRDDKFEKISVPENLDAFIDESIERAVRMQKARRKKKIIGICTGMAAAAATFSIVCVSFPSLAAKLPFIGQVFQQVENQVSYKGDYSALAKPLAQTGEKESDTGEEIENPYVQTSNGITMTISEAYYNKQALYLAMTIENEEEFPADFNCTENMEGYILDYDTLQLTGTERFSFMNQDSYTGEYIEGKFEDAHTFVGIYRIDVSHLTWWPTEEELEEKGLAAENADTDTIMAAFPEANSKVEAPDSFHYSLHLASVSGDLFETEEMTAKDPDGNEVTFQEPIRKEYTGEWNFELDVQLDTSNTQTMDIQEVNDQGVGIATVEKTPYEITAQMILPEGKSEVDYFLVICDADGDLLDYQGSIADTYQVYGRNTDTVYVYVCDETEYLNEIKGYYWSEDYQEKKKTKTFKQYLDEKALYGVEVTF